MRLEHMTWPQAEAYFKNNDTVIIPLGSLECHGRHMPLGTDTLIPEKIIDDLKRYRADIGPIKNNKFNLEDLYSPDTCFFILVIIVLYTIFNDRVVGESENE